MNKILINNWLIIGAKILKKKVFFNKIKLKDLKFLMIHWMLIGNKRSKKLKLKLLISVSKILNEPFYEIIIIDKMLKYL